MNRYLLVDGNNLASLNGLQPAHLIIVLVLFMAVVALAAWVVKLIWRRRK